MALYAHDEGTPIYAANATVATLYQCAGCGGKVKVRKGARRIPHFYHVAVAPACRLYGKSQNHLRAQLAIAALLPPGEATLEKPFPSISRIADVAWEPRKIVFEIQCSHLPQKEAEQRTRDYKAAGFSVVWLLDDRLFNQRSVGSAEQWIRRGPSYYVLFVKESAPIFYDQFELVCGKRRIKRGMRLRVSLDKPRQVPQISWKEEAIPKQIFQKATSSQLFFEGDLVDKALRSLNEPLLAISMHNLRAQERAAPPAPMQNKFSPQMALWPLRWVLLQFLKRASKPL